MLIWGRLLCYLSMPFFEKKWWRATQVQKRSICIRSSLWSRRCSNVSLVDCSRSFGRKHKLVIMSGLCFLGMLIWWPCRESSCLGMRLCNMDLESWSQLEANLRHCAFFNLESCPCPIQIQTGGFKMERAPNESDESFRSRHVRTVAAWMFVKLFQCSGQWKTLIVTVCDVKNNNHDYDRNDNRKNIVISYKISLASLSEITIFYHVQIHCACQWIMTIMTRAPKYIGANSTFEHLDSNKVWKSSFSHTNDAFLPNINV